LGNKKFGSAIKTIQLYIAYPGVSASFSLRGGVRDILFTTTQHFHFVRHDQ